MAKQPRKPRGFWIEVDGEPAHINGDPNMSEETLAALVEMIRAARTWLTEQTNKEEEDDQRSQSPPRTSL